MPIEITPEEAALGPDSIGQEFEYVFSAESDDPLNPVESVTVEASLEDPGGGVETSNGTSSASVSGAYTIGLFPDYRVGWVDRGDSVETVRRGFPWVEVPPDKDLTRVEPDPRASIDVSYEVTANSAIESSTKTYTHTVLNDYARARNFILDYLEKHDAGG